MRFVKSPKVGRLLILEKGDELHCKGCLKRDFTPIYYYDQPYYNGIYCRECSLNKDGQTNFYGSRSGKFVFWMIDKIERDLTIKLGGE